MRPGLCVAAFGLLLASCVGGDRQPESDIQQQRQQEQLSRESNAQTGMPGITNFTEKKMMKLLYELRDSSISTFTYTVDRDGRLHHVCDSVGYGLPYGTQFSSPSKIVPYGVTSANIPNTSHVVPQSEPNGLFMPPTAEGTWVMCAGANGKLIPKYVEPRVIVSPDRMRAVDSYVLPQ